MVGDTSFYGLKWPGMDYAGVYLEVPSMFQLTENIQGE